MYSNNFHFRYCLFGYIIMKHIFEKILTFYSKIQLKISLQYGDQHKIDTRNNIFQRTQHCTRIFSNLELTWTFHNFSYLFIINHWLFICWMTQCVSEELFRWNREGNPLQWEIGGGLNILTAALPVSAQRDAGLAGRRSYHHQRCASLDASSRHF